MHRLIVIEKTRPSYSRYVHRNRRGTNPFVKGVVASPQRQPLLKVRPRNISNFDAILHLLGSWLRLTVKNNDTKVRRGTALGGTPLKSSIPSSFRGDSGAPVGLRVRDPIQTFALKLPLHLADRKPDHRTSATSGQRRLCCSCLSRQPRQDSQPYQSQCGSVPACRADRKR